MMGVADAVAAAKRSAQYYNLGYNLRGEHGAMMVVHARSTRSRLWALACGGMASALAGCGGSDSDNEAAGTGMLQGNGGSSSTTRSGTSSSGATDEGLTDCGVDGATRRLLSPTSGEDVGAVKVSGGSIFYGVASGLYRLPVGNSSAKPERIAEGNSAYFFLNGDRVGVTGAVEDAPQLTWVPVAGGAATSVTLPSALVGRWSFDAAATASLA